MVEREPVRKVLSKEQQGALLHVNVFLTANGVAQKYHRHLLVDARMESDIPPEDLPETNILREVFGGAKASLEAEAALAIETNPTKRTGSPSRLFSIIKVSPITGTVLPGSEVHIGVRGPDNAAYITAAHFNNPAIDFTREDFDVINQALEIQDAAGLVFPVL